MMINIQLKFVPVGQQYDKILLGLIVGSLFFFETLYVFRLSLGQFDYFNGLFLGVDSSSIRSNENTSFTGPAANNTFANFIQIKTIGQDLYSYGSIWLLVCSAVLSFSYERTYCSLSTIYIRQRLSIFYSPSLP